MKGMWKASYVIGIEIFCNRSQRLLGLSQSLSWENSREIQHGKLFCWNCTNLESGQI